MLLICVGSKIVVGFSLGFDSSTLDGWEIGNTLHSMLMKQSKVETTYHDNDLILTPIISSQSG
jgi:hypothetical protein